jgi:flagella synthesis protein FlgN
MPGPLNPQSTLPFSAEELQAHIDADTAQCKQLLAILNQEQEALKERNVEEVERLLNEKVPILEALENNAKQRQTWAANATSDTSADNEARWAHLLGSLGSSSIKDKWNALKALYVDVRTQNEVNGKLLSRHQGTLNRLLDIMRGKTASPNLYSATGYSAGAAQSNKFGEA